MDQGVIDPCLYKTVHCVHVIVQRNHMHVNNNSKAERTLRRNRSSVFKL